MVQRSAAGSPAASVTQLLGAIRGGDSAALNEVVAALYPELRRLAAAHLRRERSGHTLQPTALVHELYLSLLRNQRIQYQDRAHFLAVSARLMRRVLVDHARGRVAVKRGAGRTAIPLDGVDVAGPSSAVDLLEFEDALERLLQRDDRAGRVAELRVFGGLELDEMSSALNVSLSTVKRDWRLAKAWFARELRPDPHDGRRP